MVELLHKIHQMPQLLTVKPPVAVVVEPLFREMGVKLHLVQVAMVV